MRLAPAGAKGITSGSTEHARRLPTCAAVPVRAEPRHTPVEDTAQELEHERLSSRLATIPGVELLPSHGRWVLMKVKNPNIVSQRLNRELFEGAVTVPQHLDGALRIPVRSARENEQLLKAVARVMKSPRVDADDDVEDEE